MARDHDVPAGLPKLLKRWLKLDAALAKGRIRIDTFAKDNGVDERTVQRDLAAFRALGHPTVWQEIELDGGMREWSHTYPDGIKPVFARHAHLRPEPRVD